MNSKLEGKKLFIGIGIALLLLILVASIIVVLISFKPPNNNKNGNDSGPFSQIFSRKENCQSNPNPKFATEFVDLNQIKFLAPIGAINAGSPGRAYVFTKDAIDGGSRELVPIYAPADGVLEGIVYARRDPTNPYAIGEYRLDIRVSCEVSIHFDHLDQVNDEIKKLAPQVPADNTREAAQVSLPIKAGQLLAHTNGTDRSGGFDFFLINKSQEVEHINKARWQWEQSTNAFCPYDYFTDDLKNKYYNMLQSHDGQKLQVQYCGSPSHDVAGTASGGWFQGDSTDNNGKWLEIGNQNGKVELLIRNSGAHEYFIRDYNPKILPEKLTAGASTCYSESGKWAFVRLNDATLSLAKGEGSCPSAFPKNDVETWER